MREVTVEIHFCEKKDSTQVVIISCILEDYHVVRKGRAQTWEVHVIPVTLWLCRPIHEKEAEHCFRVVPRRSQKASWLGKSRSSVCIMIQLSEMSPCFMNSSIAFRRRRTIEMPLVRHEIRCRWLFPKTVLVGPDNRARFLVGKREDGEELE